MESFRSILPDEARREISIRHLQQLDALAVDDLEAKVASRLRKRNPLAPKIALQSDEPSTYTNLKSWSEKYALNIKSALRYQVFGGNPDYSCVFLGFLESTAMYLRQDDDLLRAVVAYRRGNLENALELYTASYRWITKIAQLWSMDFVMLSDLVDQSPVGHDDWSGPFCGAFYNAEGNYPPSMGLAFKGTEDWDEIVTDYHYTPVKGGPFLKDVLVSHGIQVGLFGPFKKVKTRPEVQTAWGLITQGVMPIRPQNSHQGVTTIVHVTGHSLGASYATLLWLAINWNPLNSNIKLSLGDIFTFGSPRVGLEGLLDAYANTARGTRSWRIVDFLWVKGFLESNYYQDAVTQIPPIDSGIGPPKTVFLHIDTGIAIFSKSAPVQLPSEKGTQPGYYDPFTWDFTSQAEAHYTASYYEGLDYILSGGPRPINGEEAVRCEVPFGQIEASPLMTAKKVDNILPHGG